MPSPMPVENSQEQFLFEQQQDPSDQPPGQAPALLLRVDQTGRCMQTDVSLFT